MVYPWRAPHSDGIEPQSYLERGRLSKSVVWVQVHGLPSLWLSEVNLRTIGGMVGEVLELDLSDEGGAQWRRFTRIKVNIDIE